MFHRKSKPVAGRLVPSPRLTLYGAITIVVFAGVPVMTIAMLLDAVVWLLR